MPSNETIEKAIPEIMSIENKGEFTYVRLYHCYRGQNDGIVTRPSARPGRRTPLLVHRRPLGRVTMGYHLQEDPISAHCCRTTRQTRNRRRAGEASGL